jgi:hypothetical protein
MVIIILVVMPRTAADGGADIAAKMDRAVAMASTRKTMGRS